MAFHPGQFVETRQLRLELPGSILAAAFSRIDMLHAPIAALPDKLGFERFASNICAKLQLRKGASLNGLVTFVDQADL